jgi:beta-glucanase (GH16 family)
MIAFKRISFLIIVILIVIIAGCKISIYTSHSDSKKETRIAEINPYEPDFNDPKKEINRYQLVFHDEFNHDGPMKTEFWRAETGFVRNNEHQWYIAENGFCKGGRLIITAKKEQKRNPNYKENSSNWRTNRKYANYTSASFITKKEYHQKYDSILMIMRAKLPLQTGGGEDYGVWPAFWTTGNGPWPHGGEIDIMEYYTKRLMANFALKGKKGVKWTGNKEENNPNSFLKNIIQGKATGFTNDPNWLQKYHTWKLIGDGKFLSVYLDDVLMSKIALDTKNEDTSVREFPFEGNLCNFWINLAVGGKPHPDLEKLAETIFPRQYEIDYARIYILKK